MIRVIFKFAKSAKTTKRFSMQKNKFTLKKQFLRLFNKSQISTREIESQIGFPKFISNKNSLKPQQFGICRDSKLKINLEEYFVKSIRCSIVIIVKIFLFKIIWWDKSMATNRGIFLGRDAHNWTQKNPRKKKESPTIWL